MAKYYVQSGIYREVIQADDARKAALWAIHHVMEDVLPIYDDPTLEMKERHQVAVLQSCLVLDDGIYLNERGFDRFDSQRFDTNELVGEWHQLIVAIESLERKFSASEATSLVKQVRVSRLTS
jgi:hypothetical protein